MSIKRYNSNKDNTIANALRENLSARSKQANMGASDILELFSIFGQASSSSLEKARIILEFPVSDINLDRQSGIIPDSGSIDYVLKMCNTPHGQTTPENFTVVVHPVVQPWSEGDGLDMESYLDLEASNWASASEGVAWHSAGSDFVTSSYVRQVDVPLVYTQDLKKGTENISIKITPWVEEWLKHENGASLPGSGSISLSQKPEKDDVIKIYSHEGQEGIFKFITGSSHIVGNIAYINTGSSAAEAISDLEGHIDILFNNKIISNLNDPADQHLALTQSQAGFHGNTLISSSIPSSRSTIVNFSGGVGLPNYGVVLKLRDDFEDGSKKRSYYTKKFYSKSSHEFFLKPKIEAQWDSSRKDDRNYVIKSSSLAPSSENLNNVFHYNRFGASMVDIPNTGSNLIVRFLTSSSGGDSVGVVTSTGVEQNHITASRDSLGTYKAIFAYSGSESQLYDVWYRSVNAPGQNIVETGLFTGSGFSVYEDKLDNYHVVPSYVVNVTNLKKSYLQEEKTTLRVYTRDKNWQPNIYTKANNEAPVNNIKNLFYKVVRLSDRYEVIPYSTGSNRQYSLTSYDSQGSYFDLDMKLLEKNDAYEISFLFKDGPNYLELPEKFKFRVDP
tara:strand:+ start:8803 stop:10650 length:1848 start_codon:yes stop_codon:yes gene_type:complete